MPIQTSECSCPPPALRSPVALEEPRKASLAIVLEQLPSQRPSALSTSESETGVVHNLPTVPPRHFGLIAEDERGFWPLIPPKVRVR